MAETRTLEELTTIGISPKHIFTNGQHSSIYESEQPSPHENYFFGSDLTKKIIGGLVNGLERRRGTASGTSLYADLVYVNNNYKGNNNYKEELIQTFRSHRASNRLVNMMGGLFSLNDIVETLHTYGTLGAMFGFQYVIDTYNSYQSDLIELTGDEFNEIAKWGPFPKEADKEKIQYISKQWNKVKKYFKE